MQSFYRCGHLKDPINNSRQDRQDFCHVEQLQLSSSCLTCPVSLRQHDVTSCLVAMCRKFPAGLIHRPPCFGLLCTTPPSPPSPKPQTLLSFYVWLMSAWFATAPQIWYASFFQRILAFHAVRRPTFLKSFNLFLVACPSTWRRADVLVMKKSVYQECTQCEAEIINAFHFIFHPHRISFVKHHCEQTLQSAMRLIAFIFNFSILPKESFCVFPRKPRRWRALQADP